MLYGNAFFSEMLPNIKSISKDVESVLFLGQKELMVYKNWDKNYPEWHKSVNVSYLISLPSASIASCLCFLHCLLLNSDLRSVSHK